MRTIKVSDQLEKLVREDHDALIRVEGTLGRFAEDIKRLADSFEEKVKDHDKRLNAIELWQHDFRLTWKLILGAASVVGGLVAFVINGLIAWFSANR